MDCNIKICLESTPLCIFCHVLVDTPVAFLGFTATSSPAFIIPTLPLPRYEYRPVYL